MHIRSFHRPALAAALFAVAVAGCDQVPDAVLPSPDEGTGRFSIVDRTPRPQVPVEVILAAIGNPDETDGTVLVGLKEPGAARGVSVSGLPSPRGARQAAEAALRRGFPDFEIVRGIDVEVPARTPLGTASTTLERTFITVRPPANVARLRALRESAYVDYIVPNYHNGVARSVASSMAAAMQVEHRPWGVDTIRAPAVWNQGIVGEGQNYYLIDSGFDVSIGYNANHPDFQFNLAMNNYTQSRPDNACPNSSQRCYWEMPYHGSGVMGSAVGQRNGIGSVGVAPRTSTGVTHFKPIYTTTTGAGRLYQEDFANAVWGAGYTAPVSTTTVMQTSLGYDVQDFGQYEALRDAIRFAVNQRNAIFIAAAANNNGGPAYIPEVWSEVVGVGSLYQNKTRFSSPIDPAMELVAPGYQLRLPWNRDNDDSGSFEFTKLVSGTSYAAPMVAGVALLTLQANPQLSASALRQRLQATARDLGPAGKDNVYGYGMVDAVCAVQGISPCVIAPPLQVSISGPNTWSTGTNLSWTASASGGTGSYSYQWYERIDHQDGWMCDYQTGWSPVATGNPYGRWVSTMEYDFRVRVVVTSGTQTASSEMKVWGPQQIICPL